MREYESFGVQKKDNKTFLKPLDNPNKLLTWTEKSKNSFKEILWPDQGVIPQLMRDINKRNGDPGSQATVRVDNSPKKLAFLGLVNCDAKALDIFLKEFSHTDLLLKRSQILVVTVECKPDNNCFCTAFGDLKFKFSDIHIQEEGRNFEIFGLTRAGQKIIEENGVDKFDKKIKIREIVLEKVSPLDLKTISQEIDRRENHHEYWQKIAKQCFGCGACTVVCPLCYCFNQDFKNDLEADCHECHSWDSCFSASFSQIQKNYDFRPENSDRLHNWYHHKFSRSVAKNGYPLCTGCGRCISSCPANLNHHNIIRGLEKQ